MCLCVRVGVCLCENVCMSVWNLLLRCDRIQHTPLFLQFCEDERDRERGREDGDREEGEEKGFE